MTAVETAVDGKAMPAWAAVTGRTLDTITSFICVLLLVSIVADVMAGVISRYVFNSSFSWTETAGRWLFTYLIFMGAALAQRNRGHVTVDILTKHLPDNIRSALAFLVDLIVAFTIFSLLFHGMELIRRVGGVDILLGVPNWLKFAAIPVSAVIAIAFIILRGFEPGESVRRAIASVVVGAGLFWLSTIYTPASLVGGNSPSLVMTISFVITLLLGVPVAFAMLFSAFLAIFGANLQPAPAVVQNVVNGAGGFLLLAIPLFILAGQLMNIGGLAARLIDLARSLVGNSRGGLAQVNVFSSLLFSGVSGSSGADAALDSKLMVPQMVRNGYSPAFSCAITASSAILPNIIPPSVLMLIFAAISGASVWQLFMAGVVPGVMLAAILLAVVFIISTMRGYGKTGDSMTMLGIVRALFHAIPVLSLAALILITIRAGVVTPTEAGALAVLYALFLGKVVYRGYTWRQLYPELRNVAVEAATIGFLIGVAGPFAFVLLAEQVPQAVITWGINYASNPTVLLLLIVVFGLLIGAVLDSTVAILLLTPLLMPLIRHSGINEIHFALVLITTAVLGGITPPVGMLVFIPSQITKTPAAAIFREVTPFFLALLGGLILLVLFPAITLSFVHWVS